MEFNVKDIRTKILHPSEQVLNSRKPEKLEDSCPDDRPNISLANEGINCFYQKERSFNLYL